MARTQRNFVKGRMNKSLDERLLPNGEYIDALNVRLGSTEASEIGAVEKSKGNTQLTSLYFIDPLTKVNTPLSSNARTIGVYEDGTNETLYWFVHDPNFPLGYTGKADMIVSFNTLLGQITYHIVSLDDGSGVNTTLNFNPEYLITGVNKVENLLFFTDNYNPPRFININDAYPEPAPSTISPAASTAWAFIAGKTTIAGVDYVGFHRALLRDCPSSYGFGTGAHPTTTQIVLPGTDCYTGNVANQGYTTQKGYGIQGANLASGFALTQFASDQSRFDTYFSIISTDPGGVPGNGSMSGGITGSDGSSGTWYARYSMPTIQYTDGTGLQQNPAAFAGVSLTGVTLTEGVAYILTLTAIT